ncbi:hypothetical protein jhhlp_005356 [Lomentospora prolificans]|uniref:GH18 domain-containing protein n=1 Tax=Lomentospora prolificans TaxID=41688 RepID=A0A2N3N7S2_9PEZI|nr:hypothetical protein jhhlp_005356 [Lomentospora prolificans]
MEEIEKVVDYMVYMTYNLHGQTETLGSLSMITKARVLSNKVIVGVSSYSYSFCMATAGYTGMDCSYTGSSTVSDAKPGQYTNTSSYLANTEIKEIISNNGNIQTWVDKDSDSNILVYDDIEWVAWMDDATKKRREELYRSYHFRGTCDWAVDLQNFVEPPNYTGGDTASNADNIGWLDVKQNLFETGRPTCDLERRTGSWVSISCTKDEVASVTSYLPWQRWEAADASSAWDDGDF